MYAMLFIYAMQRSQAPCHWEAMAFSVSNITDWEGGRAAGARLQKLLTMPESGSQWTPRAHTCWG